MFRKHLGDRYFDQIYDFNFENEKISKNHTIYFEMIQIEDDTNIIVNIDDIHLFALLPDLKMLLKLETDFNLMLQTMPAKIHEEI